MEQSDINSKDFLGKFSLTKEEEENIQLFSSPNDIGFSIQKTYPRNILFKSAKTKKGDNDSIAIIWISYRYKEENRGRVPIYLRISKQSKYLMRGHYDYNFEDESSPTKESLEISNRSIQPAELESYGDYFYDINADKFLENTQEISPDKIIKDIYKQHIKTADKLKGIRFRSKYKGRDLVVNGCEIGIRLTKWILIIFFGRDLQRKGDDDELLSYFSRKPLLYKKEDLLPTAPNKISILGLETDITKKSFLTVCGIIAIICIGNTYRRNINFIRAKELFSQEIFLGAIALVGLSAFDNYIPRLFFWIINHLIAIKHKWMFMKIKVK